MGHQNNDKKIGFGPGPFLNLGSPERQCADGGNNKNLMISCISSRQPVRLAKRLELNTLESATEVVVV